MSESWITRLVKPDSITPLELDGWLRDGWFRVGQSMMTCRLMVNPTGLRSTVWTRLPLAAFRFSKSQRKLLSGIRRDFRVTVGEATIDTQTETLYARYLTAVSGRRSPTLRSYCLGDEPSNRFPTQQISIWDGQTLAAMSLFDVGQTSVQSLAGFYDPAYTRRSLGFATLLLEIEHARTLGLDYHYSGYVLPGDPSMDYKLRTQPMEFLDHSTGQWRPWDEFDAEARPDLQIRTALREVLGTLRDRRMPSWIEENEPFSLNAQDANLLSSPLTVVATREPQQPKAWLVTWDLNHNAFRVQLGIRALARIETAGSDDVENLRVWLIQDDLGLHATVEDATARIEMEADKTPEPSA